MRRRRNAARNLLVPAALAVGAAVILWPKSSSATPRKKPSTTYTKIIYTPGGAKQIALFEKAARQAGLPEAWASDPAFINILKRESAGVVGRPNYQYGERSKDPNEWPGVWDELRRGILPKHSSATGLGQLVVANVDAFYPHGRSGIGVALDEAVGMLRYIKKRYGTPAAAWEFWQSRHWY